MQAEFPQASNTRLLSHDRQLLCLPPLEAFPAARFPNINCYKALCVLSLSLSLPLPLSSPTLPPGEEEGPRVFTLQTKPPAAADVATAKGGRGRKQRKAAVGCAGRVRPKQRKVCVRVCLQPLLLLLLFHKLASLSLFRDTFRFWGGHTQRTTEKRRRGLNSPLEQSAVHARASVCVFGGGGIVLTHDRRRTATAKAALKARKVRARRRRHHRWTRSGGRREGFGTKTNRHVRTMRNHPSLKLNFADNLH